MSGLPERPADMAPLKVGVSLDGLPRMLRDIIVEALGTTPAIRVEPLTEQGSYDAIVTAANGSAEAHLRRGAAGRVVDVAPEGRQAWSTG